MMSPTCKKIAFFTLSLLLLPILLPTLHAKVKIAILGDSITYAAGWPSLVESALRHSGAGSDAEIVNFGVPSETVSGLSEPGHAAGKFDRPDLHERLQRVCDAYQPNVILACYGMNDGIYQAFDSKRFQAFKDGMNKLKKEADKRKARIIFITAPLYFADNRNADSIKYDSVLDNYANWQVEQRKNQWQVIDIRKSLRNQVTQAKFNQPNFVYARDGIHPGGEGHQFIANAVAEDLWKTLRLKGQPWFDEGEALNTLRQRHNLLRDAWLTDTKHKRPEIAGGPGSNGKSVKDIEAEAKSLLERYQTLSKSAPNITSWNGFEQINFSVAGRAAFIVKPKTSAPGNPWIWRTEFFGHEPQGDLALLEKGFHVVYINVENMYGSPNSMRIFDSFYGKVIDHFSLSSRPILEGFSRGGLFALNWSIRHPDLVSGIYVDAPVCDFKSWPGGKGKGPGSPEDWQNLLKAYGLSEKEALEYPSNPIDQLEGLAKAKIPIFAIIGDADDVVPVSENIDILEQRYLKLGGKIKVIRKAGVKHHPHSLPDPKPIVDFALQITKP